MNRLRSVPLIAALAFAAGAGAVQVAPRAEQSGARPGVASQQAPVAAKRPYQVRSRQGARPDEYYWLRDDKRQSKEVLDYLNAENAYRDAVTAPTQALRESPQSELAGGEVERLGRELSAWDHVVALYTEIFTSKILLDMKFSVTPFSDTLPRYPDMEFSW